MPNSNNFTAPITKDLIKVGYIDPELGFIDGLSICDANLYASQHPGTIFLFIGKDRILQFLSINGVNKLTPNDINGSSDSCAGIQNYEECGPPVIQFFGGSGIGAAGNPVIGTDGALLGVDLISKGFGYQYPPIVNAIDHCSYGNGAVLTAILGESSEIYEVYSDEEDFEVYELCDTSEIQYGRNYGTNGEDLGPWSPNSYIDAAFNPEVDPIQREIELYKQSISKLNNPFFTTRKNQPTSITSKGEDFSTTYDVTDSRWGSFMNEYAISPVAPSNVPGSDYVGRLFSFIWDKQNFPYDGDYIFKGLCDNKAKLYVDNFFIGDLGSFADAVNPIKKSFSAGVYSIRVDLLNNPINTASTIQTQNIFNTIDYINKANRPLWRVNVYNHDTSGFINSYGICPFDTTKILEDNPYSGTHGITWSNVTFPTSGEYRIQIAVDDNVTLYIGDTVIRKEGFYAGTSKSTGTLDATYTFNSGTYSIRAELEQIPDGAFRFTGTLGSNPMALAISIDTVGSDNQVIEGESFNLNPMGIAIAIDSPVLSIPKEIPLAQEGPCPPSPIWSTRFPGSLESWYPVRYDKGNAWSKFMNRYALSPVPPLDTPGSDKSGITFKNSWNIDLPYAGYYGLKATADNVGKILIDRQEVLIAEGFNSIVPTTKKVFLDKGAHTIEVEVYNQSDKTTTSIVRQKIFSTQDWQIPLSPALPPQTSILCQSSGGKSSTGTGGNVIAGQGKAGKNGTTSGIGGNSWGFDGQSTGSATPTTPASTGQLLLSRSSSDIQGKSASPFGGGGAGSTPDIIGSAAEGSPTPKSTSVSPSTPGSPATPGSSGSVRISFWGKNYDYTSPGVYEFIIPDRVTAIDIFCIGGGAGGTQVDTTKNLNIGNKLLQSENLQGGIGGGGAAYAYANNLKAIAGAKIQIVVGSGGGVGQDGTDTYVQLIGAEGIADTTNITKIGITYSGIELFKYNDSKWGDFMNTYSVSPKVFEDINLADEKVVGTKILTWKNVNFPETGTYDIRFQADNIAVLKVNGNTIQTVSDFTGDPLLTKATISAGTYDVTIELTNYDDRNYFFRNNPIGAALVIEKNVSIVSADNSSWAENNPVAISAILIPPPCKRIIKGKGIVDRVIIEDPGNGYLSPSPNDNGYPVTLQISDIIITDPGINYDFGVDTIRIIPDRGCQLSYTCDSFGRIASVKVNGGGLGFTQYPQIVIDSETGVNFSATPVMTVIRDPLLLEPKNIIQVTDLVGLKQTGYYAGRAYYGAVFYKDGIKYAGYYQTAGQLIQIYDTLEESITSTVTSPISAIPRYGTDTNNNNPRFNIPGTPDTISEI